MSKNIIVSTNIKVKTNTTSSRKTQREAAQRFLDNLQNISFPHSKRIYLTGYHYNTQVPMREIQLSPTLVGGIKDEPLFEENEAIPVYDTSSAYGDPDVIVNIKAGLKKCRQRWILDRNDTELVKKPSSYFTQQRLTDAGLDHLRFNHRPQPLKAQTGKTVTQLHYARRGIITPEMEFIAIRENMGRAFRIATEADEIAQAAGLAAQHHQAASL